MSRNLLFAFVMGFIFMLCDTIFAQGDEDSLVLESKSESTVDLVASVSDHVVVELFPPPLRPDGSYDVPVEYPSMKANEIMQPCHTTMAISKKDMRVTYEPYPLPEPSNRWKTVLLVNGAIICAMLALYFYFRWRKELAV